MQPAARRLLLHAARKTGALHGTSLWQSGVNEAAAAAVTPLLATQHIDPAMAFYSAFAAPKHATGGGQTAVGEAPVHVAPGAASIDAATSTHQQPAGEPRSSSYEQAYEALRAEQQQWSGDHAAEHIADEPGSHEAGGEARDNAEGDAAREQLLEHALRHVARLGWTQAALVAAAGELGLSPAAVGLLGGSDAAFVQAFCDRCNRQLETQLAGMSSELAAMRVRDRVAAGVRLRLAMLAPYIDSWPRAMALLAAPPALPRTLAQYAGKMLRKGSWGQYAAPGRCHRQLVRS